jgi:hypothetical protein
VSESAALSLQLVDPLAIKAKLVDKVGLLELGRAECVLWTKPMAPARDWTTSIDQAASFGIDAQRIRWMTDRNVQADPEHFLGKRDPFAMASWALVTAGDGSVIPPAAGVAHLRTPDVSAVPGLMTMAGGRATAPADLLGSSLCGHKLTRAKTSHAPATSPNPIAAYLMRYPSRAQGRYTRSLEREAGLPGSLI